MENLQKLDDGLYRILVPFEELTTTVYLLNAPQGAAIIDAATYASDITDYVLPALEFLKIDTVSHLLLTHTHDDHAGGLPKLMECFPQAQVGSMTPMDLPGFSHLRDGDILLDRLQTVHLPGHTQNSCGFLDLPTGTLLSGDCLQLGGIGKYVHGIGYPDLYRASVEKLKAMPICCIVAAHEFNPLGSIARGKAEVQAYLNTCLNSLLPQTERVAGSNLLTLKLD